MLDDEALTAINLQEGLTLIMHMDEDEDLEEEMPWFEPLGAFLNFTSASGTLNLFLLL